jgi:hypothetical protein
MKRCAVYLRVSTSDQTCDNQRDEVISLVTGRGFELVEVYEETGSAAKHRPAFERMRLNARRGGLTCSSSGVSTALAVGSPASMPTARWRSSASPW